MTSDSNKMGIEHAWPVYSVRCGIAVDNGETLSRCEPVMIVVDETPYMYVPSIHTVQCTHYVFASLRHYSCPQQQRPHQCVQYCNGWTVFFHFERCLLIVFSTSGPLVKSKWARVRVYTICVGHTKWQQTFPPKNRFWPVHGKLIFGGNTKWCSIFAYSRTLLLTKSDRSLNKIHYNFVVFSQLLLFK